MIDLLAVHGELQRMQRGSTALVLLDLQKVCIEQWVPPETVKTLLANVSEVLAWARAVGLLVVHVRVAFRSGYPEISPANKLFSKLASTGLFDPSSPHCEFHEAVEPAAEEPVVEKHRVGAFSGTDLDMILRSRGIQTLILCGISTTGALLSALRVAFDLDYQVIVPKDCCADPEPEVHEFLMSKIIPFQATVVSLEGLKSADVF